MLTGIDQMTENPSANVAEGFSVICGLVLPVF